MKQIDSVTERRERMPVLFVGHGSPMNAIEQNRFHKSWRNLGEHLPRPQAVLCISAHWETNGTWVTGSERPETIHDFYGFPRELFAVSYPAPGDPRLAQDFASRAGEFAVQIDPLRGLDHGAWSVLRVMYPDASIPVLQCSLDIKKSGAEHYAFARTLMSLRDEGVLVLASGNIIHNLRLFRFYSEYKPAWALRFQEKINSLIYEYDHAALVDYDALGDDARVAIPTPEHFIPLLYALALQDESDHVTLFNDDLVSAISMTSLLIARAQAEPSPSTIAVDR